MSSRVTSALIGFGHLGKWHAQKMESLETCDFRAIVESDKSRHQEIQKLYPKVRITDDIFSVLSEIDAAVIATPTSTHHKYIEILMDAGKHLFCEKPMVSNWENLKEIESKLHEYKGVFQVGHSERCHAVWEKREDYESFFKDPCYIEINRCAPFKGRATDVDVVSDLMIHDIDLLLWLFGPKPISVAAVGAKMRTSHWDFVHADFMLENGGKVSINASRNDTLEKRGLNIVNSEGTLSFDLLGSKFHYASSIEKDASQFVKIQDYEKRDHLFFQQESFYNSILKSTPVFVTFDDGKNALKVLESVQQSLLLSQQVSL